VHKSTAFRLVSVLENRGLVEQYADRGKYRLGLGLVRLAGATTARLDLTQQGERCARPLPRARRDHQHRDPVRPRRALPRPGRRHVGAADAQLGRPAIPLHCTSNGKALIAYLPEDRQRALLVEPLVRFTDRTITDVDELLVELEQVRLLGYATPSKSSSRG